jgi:hypothetical protein
MVLVERILYTNIILNRHRNHWPTKRGHYCGVNHGSSDYIDPRS